MRNKMETIRKIENLIKSKCESFVYNKKEKCFESLH